ncbi:hypothetical protein LEP1GSC071_0040 [Leptospira santarosai str. JET]|nr:hypothetical protein LEP1GSC071_0040 [Leptospira santarosai str. JET]
MSFPKKTEENERLFRFHLQIPEKWEIQFPSSNVSLSKALKLRKISPFFTFFKYTSNNLARFLVPIRILQVFNDSNPYSRFPLLLNLS